MQTGSNTFRVIIGLGNMGSQYTHTRHNAGFLLLDKLAKKYKLSWQQKPKLECEVANFPEFHTSLLKPTTMMNLSGKAVAAYCQYFDVGPDQILVAHDDLDIDLGQYKLQFATGPKVHNGLISIQQALGTEKFWRLRVGVENRIPKGSKLIAGMDYALQRFSEPELEMVYNCLEQIISQHFSHDQAVVPGSAE